MSNKASPAVAGQVERRVGRRQYRRPTEDDKQREKCRARSRFEKSPFYVSWNAEHNCWAMYGRPHILVAVDEILEPANAELSRHVKRSGTGSA